MRSLLFNILFGAWTAVMFVAGLPTLVLARGATWAMGRLWIRGGVLLLRLTVGLDHRVLGGEQRIAGPA
ncbi:MAG TPA: 1-acyl-sn-glycerol-3-phosphate acyltransferase, partial [Methylomirabilota bacterium]|nr:1-acyl-sn-glycerol-3-phosphate acyltransferase [Methylomirabilota bacterium]